MDNYKTFKACCSVYACFIFIIQENSLIWQHIGYYSCYKMIFASFRNAAVIGFHCIVLARLTFLG